MKASNILSFTCFLAPTLVSAGNVNILAALDRRVGNIDGRCDFNAKQCVVNWQHGAKGQHGISKDPCRGNAPKGQGAVACHLEDWEVDGTCVGPGNTWGACQSVAQSDRGRKGMAWLCSDHTGRDEAKCPEVGTVAGAACKFRCLKA
ncbi:hypothetical protein BT63DRAFT_212849 [Microthyrium microscopicum]|uniref:Uncharacterized protein n=1 Tax=Microthyrium microscopicum TaxID=703497 RepID=A0A6A6UK86_9PEZI|nr:hypothetical protein BT63DRAFT_212849 [Microthyrium microscopicum]